MVHRGHWRLACDGSETVLAPGDTCLVLPGLARSLVPAMSGESVLFRVRGTDDPAGPTPGFGPSPPRERTGQTHLAGIPAS